MKNDSDLRPEGVSSLTGDVLSEALPWIKNITGKTIVIKYGGAAMEKNDLRSAVMADILLLKIIGINPVIVHGGGKAINAEMESAGLEVEFVDGQRVTSDAAMEVVRKVLVGEVNPTLVAAMNAHGNMAVGLNGADGGIIMARQADPKLGRVGRVSAINAALIQDLIADDYIPVIATVALGEDEGIYNVNADRAAGSIAAAIGAHKIMFLTDVDGLYADYPDPASFIAQLDVSEAEALVASGKVASGMIPKVNSCIYALKHGVHRGHILNGARPHALLLELLTTRGIGTMVKSNDSGDFATMPVGHFASKLVENLPAER